ncbi:RNA-guided endonuclease TnpB family protein [Cetobacterium sp. 2G large]|uniref:RNA-guided endonuclease InsQ/TnpB family protein n=1 Tax=Cetobacterium sp. 2G large TaxID=2759680 RepID=UPI00163CF645|nr:RNA-guided endonuclease TnpB family protein [Cetobacterium sp. 2G large]MBC2854229.1 IS200/IS605 family element transposase accessory protein TnpB [Cetobacterium sp. 2G large]
MILSKKIRLKPNKNQELFLWQSTGTARFIYNWTLNRQKENYENGGKFLSDNILRKEITELKKSELEWLSQVSNNVAKQAVKDACDSYKKFFKKQSAFPKFKSRKKAKPSFYNDTSKLKVKENLVLIEKVGWVKTSEQIPMNTKYTNPRISFDGKYWYISVGIDSAKHVVELTDEKIGIDLGIKELAVCSNGRVFKNVNKGKRVKKLKKTLKRLQKQVSRKYYKNNGGENRYQKSQNILKLEQKLRLIHRRISNIRNNNLHQITNEIVKTKPSKIVMEDLNVKGMMKNRHLSKAIAEQNFHKFVVFMKYKCKFNGIEFIQVPRFYPSSKTCSCCGSVKKNLKLSDRIFSCECGNKMDRDLNASINLRNYRVS